MPFNRSRAGFVLAFLFSSLPLLAQTSDGCARTIKANVSALDQPYLVNRLGAMMPEGMVFALDRDIVATTCPTGPACKPSKGNARLRDGKRARPIVLRANLGDCLSIHFTNLLSETSQIPGVQPATRYASVHVAGMQLVKSIKDDGSYVGVNASSNIAPGDSITYVLHATAEGTFLLNSEGAVFGGLNVPNDGAQISAGLFGAVNVEPKGATWFRSQLTHDEMLKAIDHYKGHDGRTSLGQPLLNFDSPVLKMLDGNNEIVASDLTAVIAGPKSNNYRFPVSEDPNTKPIPYEPGRREPFREFTIEYHELNDTQQAFPIFDFQKASLTGTIQVSGDEFAINYGSGAIGAEILANRFGIGPMNSCPDCKFEEFFLSSWTVGDPASIVDYPANAPCSGSTFKSPPDVTNPNAPPANCTPGVAGNAPENVTPLRKATKVLYPDDPSNVYHSYINDRVVFRVLHAGTGVSHVHHLHAHQWFHSPNSDGSAYLDSQLINPGSAYTMEIAHNGSGNLNKVVGDSIFHCHFYPHFAAGMWAMWRSHDVFETGTELDSNGVPKPGWNRSQPDGEIAAGTPVPALVPLPTLPMAPMPARVQLVEVPDPNGAPGAPPVGYRSESNADDLKNGLNPGYPFFIPGVGGTRAPHPPLDFAVDKGKELNGGLPRHMMLNAKVTNEQHTYLNFAKDLDYVNAYKLPEEGTVDEKAAMSYHSKCTHSTFTAEGAAAKYRTNGLPPAHGAPYADPGLASPSDSDLCTPIKTWTNYRAAAIETDVVLNKVGWHYPQSRLLTLWEDVLPTMNAEEPPQPFFIRANSRTGVNYWHTNLVPAYYLLDDYQVRTPTDIIGQHIHLVKFDVTSSDGAANGFNYEDGTLSYGEVQDLIKGINECGGLAPDARSIGPCQTTTATTCVPAPGRSCLTAEAPPKEICPDPTTTQCSKWFGAQTTVQRWYADPLSDESDAVNGERTLRTVFTHDHFGPSTHQQTGLYAALLVEPANSKWYKNEDGQELHTRDDGGPTTWQAVIHTPDSSPKNTYREFALAIQDFQFAYQPDSIPAPKNVTGTQTDKNGKTSTVDGGPSWYSNTTNGLAIEPVNIQPTQPGPTIVSAGPTVGTTSFNYRNEPLPFRVQPAGTSTVVLPHATDLGYVFSSNIQRYNSALNNQPTPGTAIGASGFKFPPPLTKGLQGGDPYTPLLRAYEGDRVQVRVVVGAHMLPHDFTIAGMKWLFEPSFSNSGHRSNQSMGISEHFEFLFETPRAAPSSDPTHNWSDYLYMPDASNQAHGIVDGTWGIFRAYKTPQTAPNELMLLPTNKDVKPLPPPKLASGYSCPPEAPKRAFTINAATAGQIVFNSRGVDGAGKFPNSKIVNPYQLMYTFLNMTPPGSKTPTTVVSNVDEPMILRANAGECVSLTLQNQMDPTSNVFQQYSNAKFDANINLYPSPEAGITPALMSYDVMASSGLNVGFNPVQTVAYNQQQTYYWYAGQTHVDRAGKISGTPMELGSVNLTPPDPLEQDLHGLVGGLIVEPKDTVACYDVFNPQPYNGQVLPTYASATVYDGKDCNSGKLRYREFVLVTQDDLASLQWSAGCYCAAKTSKTGANCTPCLSPVETAIASPSLLQVAANYRTEPMSYRFNATKYVNLDTLWRAFSDGWVQAEPQTPIFAAARNTPVRFRLLHPGGSGNQQVLALHGHVWQELPWTNGSKHIGDNPLSMWLGARDNYGTNTAYEVVLERNGGAGGRHGILGDYVYRTTPANFLTQGLWGLFRVGEPGKDAVRLAAAQFSSAGLAISGSSTVFIDNKANAKNGQRAATVSLYYNKRGTPGNGTLISDSVQVTEGGLWSYSGKTPVTDPDAYDIIAISPLGGRDVKPISLVLLPATPADAQEPNVVGESQRFVDPPRVHKGDKPIVISKPKEGLLAPAEPGVPQAPKSAPTPPSQPPPQE
jgi:hypothetical protein